MKKISLKSIKSEELLSREELKQIVGGDSGSGGTCCLHEHYGQTGEYVKTCGISSASANYACETRPEDNPGYTCHVTC